MSKRSRRASQRSRELSRPEASTGSEKTTTAPLPLATDAAQTSTPPMRDNPRNEPNEPSAKLRSSKSASSQLVAASLSVVAGVAILWLTPLAEAVGPNWRIGGSVMFAIIVGGFLVWRRHPARSAQVLATVVVGAVVTGVITLQFEPSAVVKSVEAYFEICTDEMWGTERVDCLEESKEVMADNFEDYAPDAFHSYSPEFQAMSVSALALAQGGPGFGGTKIRSVGQVVASQPLGALEQTIQLRPPTAAAMKQFEWKDVASYFPPGTNEEDVIAPLDPSEDEVPTDYFVYLNVATRHFFGVTPGELVVFDGLPIAHGLVLQVRSGRTLPTTYVRGHSIEHLAPVR